jgi:dihydroorotate dehydrogenase
VKIAPDLEDDAIDTIARLAYEEGLAGVIAVNTSVHRLGLEGRRLEVTGQTLAEEAGGLSGRPLRRRDPQWGLRSLEAVASAAEGFGAPEVIDMPANNLTVAFRRASAR